MVRIETPRYYRITNKSRWLDFKEERASSALFIPSLWYNSRFLLSFTCKRRVVKLISRYSTYARLRASLPRPPSLFLPTSRRRPLPPLPPRRAVRLFSLSCRTWCFILFLFRSFAPPRISFRPRAYTAASGGHTEQGAERGRILFKARFTFLRRRHFLPKAPARIGIRFIYIHIYVHIPPPPSPLHFSPASPPAW